MHIVVTETELEEPPPQPTISDSVTEITVTDVQNGIDMVYYGLWDNWGSKGSCGLNSA
jgi:hypothetical protein